jgi:hypothetical protein
MKLLCALPLNKESLYLCHCGSYFVSRTSAVNTKKTQSCGCLRTSVAIARNTKHGMYGTPIYSVWRSMLNRCTNPETAEYMDYGGRGIQVTEGWTEFSTFYADMGDPNGLTLDRIDNEKGYSKENCRWVSMKAQQNNKRSNVLLTYQGQTKNITQWGEALGIDRQRIYDRIRSGWSTDQALSKA